MIDPLPEPSAERLFSSFLDPVDGTACFPATSTPEQIEEACNPLGLRFPLQLDPSVSLLENVAASTHAPASSRFGPFCDNILGMNWQCPNGNVVRIGERVAKTTTGYDWLRFLLHSGTRFGVALDYVLRLRPKCTQTHAARLRGNEGNLQLCLRELIYSGWMHWWDAVDFIAESEDCHLRVVYHSMEDEAPAYSRRVAEIATAHDIELSMSLITEGCRDGLPDLVLKTTPDATVDLARRLAREGHRCVALWYSGVVHAYFGDLKNAASHAEKLGTALAPSLEADGGDWHSRHFADAQPRHAERDWLRVLQEALETE